MHEHWYRLPRVPRTRSPQVWCGRCGLPVGHGASASGLYGTSDRTGAALTPRIAGSLCCCRVPDVVSDQTP